MFAADSDPPYAVGRFVHVFVDPKSRAPVPLSPRHKRAVADLCTVSAAPE
jgi:acyl-CoA thioesterase FadM